MMIVLGFGKENLWLSFRRNGRLFHGYDSFGEWFFGWNRRFFVLRACSFVEQGFKALGNSKILGETKRRIHPKEAQKGRKKKGSTVSEGGWVLELIFWKGPFGCGVRGSLEGESGVTEGTLFVQWFSRREWNRRRLLWH
jgi:hypothetical protein